MEKAIPALILSLAILCIWPLGFRVVIGKRVDVFEPIYAIAGFYFLLFVFTPWSLLKNGARLETEMVAWALLYAIVGILAFYAGYFARIGHLISFDLPGLPYRWRKRELSYIALAFILIGLFAIFVRFYIVLGVSPLYAMRGGIIKYVYMLQEMGIGNLYLYLMSWVRIAFILLWAGFLFRRNVKASWVAIAFLFALISAFTTGFRSSIIFFFLMILMVWHYAHGKKVKLVGIVIILCLVLLSLTELQYFRFHGTVTTSPSLSILELPTFEDFANIVDKVPDTYDYLFGRLYLQQITLAWIPRIIWPNKPVLSVNVFYTNIAQDPDFRGVSTITMLGDLYWNFGIAGIVMGMFLFGIFMRVVYAYREHYHENPTVMAFYALTLTIAINYLRSNLMGFFIAEIKILVPLLLFTLVASGTGKLYKKKVKRINSRSC